MTTWTLWFSSLPVSFFDNIRIAYSLVFAGTADELGVWSGDNPVCVLRLGIAGICP